MTDSWEVHEIGSMTRIELARPEALTEPLASSTNVYLSVSDAGDIGLVNSGHPLQRDALREALASLDITPPQIDRVVYTSWEVDSLGNSELFASAAHMVVSPDMQRPRDYGGWVDEMRGEVRGYLDWLESKDVDLHDAELDSLYPEMPDKLAFMPIRPGLKVCVGSLELEVIATPGFDPGHALLWSADHRTLFCGNIEFDGLPSHIREVQGYLISVERSIELNPELVLPGRGAPQPRGVWSLRRTLRWANNYLSNVGAALVGGPTLAEFVERDRGRGPENPVEFALLMRQYRPFLDELARSRMIEIEGKGLDIRYGIDVEDPRAKLR